ncbi:MAG: pseudouridine synthase [Cardiobacteriaceae bacterium]|nr:pseudouridine synthase [Cardiobacteriaceae bacterium]
MLILFNKPFNVLCQFTDKSGRATLADYIDVSGVYPAGLLDYDSEGLVVLTDDGRMQARIADPRFKLEKTYWVQVEGVPDDAALGQLREGVWLKDKKAAHAKRTLPAQVQRMAAPDIWPRNPPIRVRKSIPTAWLALTIREGRNRQVRRMTAAVGFPTLRLLRVRIGKWHVAGLQSGAWKIITNTEGNHYESSD